MRPSRPRRSPQGPPGPRLRDYVLVIVLVLAIGAAGLAYAWWQQWRLAQERGIDPAILMPPETIAISVAGLIGFACYLTWVMLLLMRIRPWLATRLGERLGVTIRERYRGHWSVTTPGRPGAGLLVTLADIVVLIGGTLGPFALMLIVLFLLFAR